MGEQVKIYAPLLDRFLKVTVREHLGQVMRAPKHKTRDYHRGETPPGQVAFLVVDMVGVATASSVIALYPRLTCPTRLRKIYLPKFFVERR